MSSELIDAVIRRWRILVAIPIAICVTVIGVSFLFAARYIATSSFVPEASTSLSLSNALGGLGAFASQLAGLSSLDNGADAPTFYQALLQSREVLDTLLSRRFGILTDHGTDSLPLSVIIEREDAWLLSRDPSTMPARRRLERDRRSLLKRLSIDVDNTTSIVSVSVETEDPDLSAAVANAFVDEVQQFNLTKRSTEARDRRVFVEGRVQATHAELESAEDAYRHWLEENRDIQSSPRLLFESQRFQREIDRLQDLYLELSREYEEARIAEADHVPIITVVDHAAAPWRKAWPQRSALAVLALIGGLLIDATIAVLAIYWTHLPVDTQSRLRDVWRRLPFVRRG